MKYFEFFEGKCISIDVSDVQFEETYDFIVAGLGSSGTFCAMSAAREGLKVLGFERGTCAGGMSTQGAINFYYNGYRGGYYETVDHNAATRTGRIYSMFTNHPDSKKAELDRQLKDAGVTDVSYHSVALGIYAENQAICGIRLLQEGKIHQYGCRFLADCTSDGHLMKILGMATTMGRSTDGMTQPFSSIRVFRTKDGRIARTNDDSGLINPFDDDDFSHAVIIAHGKHTKDCEPTKQRFLYNAPLIGIREGALLRGESQIRLQDILNEKEWPDTLLCMYSDIDKHGVDHAFDDTLYQDWYVISNLSTVTFKIRIPLRALVPKGWKGVICASRCISADNYSSAAIRMNRDMYRLGEAAGLTVAMAVKAGTNTVLELSYEQLHSEILRHNCFDPVPGETKGFVTLEEGLRYHPIEWLTDWEEIKKQLATNCPGVAIWSCRCLGLEKVGDLLTNLLKDTVKREDRDLRMNAAVALGLLGDARALPVLREIVQERCAYYYLDNRRSNQLRSVIAICLCGRFHDLEILPELYNILEPEEYEKSMYHEYMEKSYKLGTEPDMSSVYYQHFSFTVAALTEMASVNSNYREDIYQKLHKAVDGEDFVMRMTEGKGTPAKSPHDRLIQGIRNWINRKEKSGN